MKIKKKNYKCATWPFFSFTSFSMSDIILPPILSGSPGLSYLKAGSGKKTEGEIERAKLLFTSLHSYKQR